MTAFKVIGYCALVAVSLNVLRIGIFWSSLTTAPLALAISLILFAAFALDIWSLHRQQRCFWSSYLIPAVVVAFLGLGLVLVDAGVFVWIMATLPLLFMRLPLKIAQIVSSAFVIYSVVIFFTLYSHDYVNLIRAFFAGSFMVISLSVFFQMHKTIEQQLRNKSGLLKDTIESISQGISVFGADQRVELMNNRACELLNLPRSFVDTNPRMSDVIRFQLERGDFKFDARGIGADAREDMEIIAKSTDRPAPRHYVRRDLNGNYLEVKSQPTESGWTVRTYTDVTNYEAMNLRLKEILAEHQELSRIVINKNYEKVVESMTTLASSRDRANSLHIKRTQLYVRNLAQVLGRTERYKSQLSPDRVERIVKASAMHDIGKVGIPDHILFKTTPHTPDESALMRTHPLTGQRILVAAASSDPQADSVLTIAATIAGGHHENWDGSGYPAGLMGMAIPLEARIMSLADTYDTLTSYRHGHSPKTHEEAIEHIQEFMGIKFDPDAVYAFEQTHEKFLAIAQELREPNQA